MATAAELKATSNAQLASNGQIPAVKHRTVNDAIIDEMFLSQSRGNVLSGVQAAAALAAGDEVIVIRGGAAYRLQADEFGFIENLVDLADVNISSPANNQAIVYDSATSRFIAKTLALTQTSQIDLGTNATAWNALGFESSRAQGIYTASNTLTLTNVNNLYSFTLQITNTGETVLTIAGITVDFKDSVLPTGVTFASNALTFPDDSAVVYNIIGVSFDGTTFDCKMELDGSSNPLSIIGGGTGAVNASGARANLGINLNDYQLISEKGANNGYGSLDSGGKVPLTQLPSTLLQYQGVWNASTNTPTLINPDTSKVSYVYNVSVAATRFGIVWSLGDWLIYNVNGDVEKSDNSDDVVSVNSQTGAVVLNTSNISEVTNLYYTEARVSANTDVAANTAKTGISSEQATILSNTSGTNTGDQSLPTDFVSASSGGAFGGSISATNLSGTNTGDQTLPTDFVSASSGGAFGGAISATNLSGTNTGDQSLPTDFVSASSGGAFGGAISATNLSGTNTGDQTLSGYALLTGANFTGNINSGGTVFTGGGNIGIGGSANPYYSFHNVAGARMGYIQIAESLGMFIKSEAFNLITLQNNVTVSGNLTATSFTGIGSGITGVNADQLGGVAAVNYARTDINETFIAGLTVTGGEISADGLSSTFGDFSSNVEIAGSLTKGSGTFLIKHPLKIKEKTHRLAHSFVEAPRGDNIYRGVLTLENGFGTINIDEHSRMTEGTFTALNKNIQCFTTNESGWTLVKGNVKGNILTIESKEVCNDTISWLVIGERHDQTFKDSSITDGEGNLIVEPLIKEA